MNKWIYSFIIAGCLMVWGCADKNKPEQKNNETANVPFIGITAFILGQLNDTDSIPVAPLRILTENGKTDSTWLKREQIRPLATEFLNPVIDSIHLNGLFTQKSFLDLTINLYTFSYDPKTTLPANMKLRRWDVYVDPATQQINRVFIVKEYKNNTGNVTEQLTWKSKESFKITTITQPEKGKQDIREEKVIWNFDRKTDEEE